ncbi:MAG: sulfurtransferase TusA family protein [Candidatus Caldarchaeales archaeon]
MRRVVDARGSFCPGPLTELIKAYRSAEVGDEIELLATDPGAKSDVSAWAKKSGNEVLEIKDEQGYFRIVVKVVRKGR